MTSRKPLVLINGVPTALPAGDTIPFQPVNTLLTVVAALVPSADQLAYFTGASTVALSTITSLGRSLIAGSTQAAMLTTLGAAPLAAPAFTGLPTAPTATQGTNTTQLATAAFVVTEISAVAQAKHATLTSLSGLSTVTTGLIKLTNGVASLDATAYAALSSPALSGTPTAPTAIQGTSTTQIASTAFVVAEIAAVAQSKSTVLTSIAGLSTGSTGLLKLTNGVATLDSNVYLTANQSITVSGDATGAGTTAIALTLANSGVIAGTYGGDYTVDAKGRLTSASKSVLTLNPGAATVVTVDIGAQGFATTPVVNFHSGATNATYDARIAATGGNGSPGMGTLNFYANTFTFSVRPTFNGFIPYDSGNLTIANYAPLASPSLTGIPVAPTAAVNTNTTQLATTAFTVAEIAASAQPKHANLTALAGLSTVTTGLVKLTNGVASLDASTYLTANQSITFSGDLTGVGTTNVALTLANSGVTAGTYGGNITVDAKGRVTGISSGQLTLDTKSAINASLEIGAQGFTNTPFIDFHSGATLTDYDSRIIASGGTGTNGGGTLQYVAATHTVTGVMTVTTPAASTNSTQVASTAYVVARIAQDAQPLNTILTSLAGLSAVTSGSVILTNGVASLDTVTYAPLESPILTGTPAAPTAVVGTNTTQVATTAYAVAEITSRAILKAGGGTITGSASAATTVLTTVGNGASSEFAYAYSASQYVDSSVNGSFIIRNKGDGTNAKPIHIAGSEVHIGVSTTVAGNFPDVAVFTPSGITMALRPTFAGNLAWDAGNLTPAAIGAMVDGMGSIGVQTFATEYILTGVALSAVRNTGMYRYSDTCTDIPSTTNGFMIQMTRESNVIYQMVVDDNLEMFNRICMSGVWGSWIQLANQADLANNTVVTTTNKPSLTVSNAWIEEVENTGEGYIGVGGGISKITTMYETQRMLYCLDSAGVKYGVALERIG